MISACCAFACGDPITGHDRVDQRPQLDISASPFHPAHRRSAIVTVQSETATRALASL